MYEKYKSPIISVGINRKSPYRCFELNRDMTIKPIWGWEFLVTKSRSQDNPITYFPNGAIFITSIASYKEKHTFYNDATRAYIMDYHYSIDIDDEIDLILAEILMKIIMEDHEN